jgi:hypothetical protein
MRFLAGDDGCIIFDLQSVKFVLPPPNPLFDLGEVPADGRVGDAFRRIGTRQAEGAQIIFILNQYNSTKSTLTHPSLSVQSALLCGGLDTPSSTVFRPPNLNQ